MTKNEIIEKLKLLGSEQIKRILSSHGAREPLFGVKVEDMKKMLKGIKGNNALAMELYSTGIYDAMYLAGLIADGAKMTTAEIQKWADAAYGSGISEYTVPWVATEHASGYDLARTWIESDNVSIAVTGWSTFTSIVSVWPDEELDHAHLKMLLDRVETTIHHSPNRVRYVMNGFIIAVGCYVPTLKDECLEIAGKTGKIKVEMNGTACKVPVAADYILKVSQMGRTGQKRKTAKC